MYCPQCGTQDAEGSYRCTNCGFELRRVTPAAATPPTTTTSSGIDVVIPYKNVAALTAYYLGVFSIGCGLVLGLPALILGIIGLKHAAQHPEAHGKVHAWIGIVLGSFMTLISLVLIALLVFAAAQS
jgi:hypothetical protein